MLTAILISPANNFAIRLTLTSIFLYQLKANSVRSHSKTTSLELGGESYPKLVTKSNIGERVLHANSDITTKKKYVDVFMFHLFLVSAAAAELWLALRLWWRFKHNDFRFTKITMPSTCVPTVGNIRSKCFIETRFEINPASLLQCCWWRWIWSWNLLTRWKILWPSLTGHV